MNSKVKIPQKLIDAIEREACKASFFEFVQSFWSIVIKEDPVYNWHIPFLCDELQKLAPYIIGRKKKPYDLIINIPPGTTKSTIVTIMFPAWLWTQDPTVRIISNSYSADLSIEHAIKSRDIIISDKYKRLFPEVEIRKDKGQKKAYENTKTGSRIAASTGGTITGKHAHLILNDDPLNPAQAASDVERKTSNEHTKTLSSRKVDKKNTITITIMQRLHDEDVTGYLIKKKEDGIRHICLPAELSDRVRPIEVREKYVNGLLDPVRLSRDVLTEAKIDLGSRGYANQYEQSPSAAGGNIIKKDWFKTITYPDFIRLRTSEPIIFFGDTGYTEEEQNDPSGFIATCKVGPLLYITHAHKVLLEFPELVRFVPTYVRSQGYTNTSSLRIEPKASGKSIVQYLKKSSDEINVTETPSPTDSKEVRLTAASPTVEAGRVVLVEGGWNEEFVEEVCGFPTKPHDEYADLIGYAVSYHFPNGANDKSNAAKAADYFG